MGSEIRPEISAVRWNRPESGTLSGHIVAQVRAALFSGELKSGDYLGTELLLAGRFGVSRIAARDALRALVAMGIVEVRTGRRGGIWISQGNPGYLANALAIQLKLIGISALEMFDAQVALETHAAELAAQRANSDDIERMRALVDELKTLVDQPDEFTAKSMDLRCARVDAAHSRALTVQFQGLRQLLEPAYRPHTTPEISAQAIEAHEKIIAMIAARDAEGARRAVAERLAYIRATGFSDTRFEPAG